MITVKHGYHGNKWVYKFRQISQTSHNNHYVTKDNEQIKAQLLPEETRPEPGQNPPGGTLNTLCVWTRSLYPGGNISVYSVGCRDQCFRVIGQG